MNITQGEKPIVRMQEKRKKQHNVEKREKNESTRKTIEKITRNDNIPHRNSKYLIVTFLRFHEYSQT